MYVHSDIGENIIRNFTIKKQRNIDKKERERRIKNVKVLWDLKKILCI